MLHRFIDIAQWPLDLYQLVRIAARTRFQLRGRYWQWRYETAFGHDESRIPGRWVRLKAILRYARWVRQMRRLGRG